MDQLWLNEIINRREGRRYAIGNLVPTWSFSEKWFWLLCWFWSIPLCSKGRLIFSWSSWFEWFLCCWSFCCWSSCCGWSFCCYWFCPRCILISTITITFSSLVKCHCNYWAVRYLPNLFIAWKQMCSAGRLVSISDWNSYNCSILMNIDITGAVVWV